MIYEISVAVVDEADLVSGHKRKKEGDIISVIPYQGNWGSKCLDEYFIIPVETDASFEKMLKLKDPLYDTDKPIIDENGEITSPVLAKHRYAISFDEVKKLNLTTIDMTKVQNKTVMYQPFKKKTEILTPFNKSGSNSISAVSIDCGTSEESEYVVNIQNNTVIYDKFLKEFIKYGK